MRDWDEDDPEYIFRSIQAALDLKQWGKAEDPLMQIIGLRASAFGFRALAEVVGELYGPAISKRHAATLIGDWAIGADKEAKRLATKVGLPVDFQGAHELLARVMWFQWRDIYIETMDSRLTLLLIVMGMFPRYQRDKFVDHYDIPHEIYEDKDLLGFVYVAGDTLNEMYKSYKTSCERAVLN